MRDDVSESDFQKVVIEYARLRGWLVHHTRPAYRQSGKISTPIQGDAGFPDLVLARKGIVYFVELKSEKGRLTAHQAEWENALRNMYDAWHHWRCWRPSDWPTIEKELA